MQSSGRQPSSDPRDFSGSYRAAQFQNAAGARGGAAGSGAPGPSAGGPPPGYVPPTGPYTSANCVPSFPAWGGGPEGSTRILQTADKRIIVSEAMHNVRRIYIDQQHPPNFQGSYSGDSIAHWDGEALVIETVGIRKVGAPLDAPQSRRTERIRKLADGSLENTLTAIGADGVASAPRTSVFNFVGDQQILEWICEDLGDVYFNEKIKL